MNYFTTKNIIKLMLSIALALICLSQTAMAQSSSIQGKKSLSQLRKELTVLETELDYQRNIINNRRAVCFASYSVEMEQWGPRCIDIADWIEYIISETFQGKRPTQNELRAAFKKGFEYSKLFKQQVRKDLIPQLQMEVTDKKLEIKNVVSQENQYQPGGSGYGYGYDNQPDNQSGDNEEPIFLFPQGDDDSGYDASTGNTANGAEQDINSGNTDGFDPTPQGYGNNSGDSGNNGGSLDSYTRNSCPSRGTSRKTYGKGRLQIVCAYYSNGQLYVETPLVDGKQHGIRYEFYKNGDIYSKHDYWNGHFVKERVYTKSGKMRICNKYDTDFKYMGSCM